MSNTYRPGASSTEFVRTSEYRAEMTRLKQALERAYPSLTRAYLPAEPERIVAGMEVLADGANWDPGSIGVAALYRRSQDNTTWELIEPIGVAAALAAHLTDTVDAHDASAISVVASGTLTAQVQTSLEALDAGKQPLDSDLTALAGNTTNGMWARTGAGTGSARTITGTANEITLANGDGVAGNPTVSIPAAVTFTGKTITGGTYASPTINGTLTFAPTTVTQSANFAWTRAIGAAAGGTTIGGDFSTTASGDAGGTSDVRGTVHELLISGANSLAQANTRNTRLELRHTAGTVTVAHMEQGHLRLGLAGSSTGDVTDARGYEFHFANEGSGTIDSARMFYAQSVDLLVGTGSINSIYGFDTGDLGHASRVTNAIGYNAQNMTASLTLTAGFRSQMNSGTGKWGFYASGTANNAFAGSVRIGSTVAPTVPLDVTGAANISGAVKLGALSSNGFVKTSGGDGTLSVDTTTYQTQDATLTALAGANWAANALPIGTGADTLSQTSFSANTFPARASTGNLVAKTITDFGLSLVDDVDAAAARTTLNLTSAATATPSALTRVDDTNVTLTLGGTPSTALLQATSLTLGWTGSLAVARGGTGATTAATARTNLGLGVMTAPLMNYGGKNFNGSTTYLDTNALTGVADAKVGTFFAIVRFAGAAAGDMYIWHSTNTRFAVHRNSNGNIIFTGANAAGTTILSMATSGGPCSAAGTYAIMGSWDLATAATGRIYINDVSSYAETTYTNDTIDYTVTEHAIGATVAGASFFSGDIYTVWFDFTQRLEFNTESVRRRFIDVNSVPVFLGGAGQLPTRTPPGVFHAYDDNDYWALNRGSFQSSTWTSNGAAATASTVLEGAYEDIQEYGRVVTVTADHTVGRTAKGVINNKGSAGVLTFPAANVNHGREIHILNIGGAFATTSASSNIVPQAGGAAGTALLAATDGVWCRIVATGANWQIIAS